MQVGTTQISATLEGYETGYLDVTVIDPSLQTMTITSEGQKTTIKVGETLQFSSSENGVSWSSSNTNVATIGGSNGLARGQGVGTSTITATKAGFNPATFLLTVQAGEAANDTYTIVYDNVPGVTFVGGKTSAKKGETVTFTVTVSDVVTLVKVTKDGTELTPSSSGIYSFVMESNDVKISAEVVGDGDVVIGGDLSITLAKGNDGVYVAKGVEVTKDSNLYYFVKQADGTSKKLSYQDFYFEKCFGKISTATDYKNYQFNIAGGFVYDFYYNPSLSSPCYIKRTAVKTLPNSPETFENLFDGGKTFETTFPDNVKHVTYTNTKTAESYEFNAYQNNVSLATVEDMKTNNQKAVVYKHYDEASSIYTVVDTYVEATNDTTRLDDYSALSAKYSVVDTVENSKYQKTKEAALFDSTFYSHDYNSLEFDIMYAYRVGFGADESQYALTSSSRSVVSTANPSGGFTTNITSSKTFNDSTEDYKHHFEYRVSIDFYGDGSIKSGTYSEKDYGTADYDFSNDTFLTGGEARGTEVKNLTFAYEYSADLETAPSFDTTPYFISNISSVRINNDNVNTDTTKNILKRGDNIQTSSGTLKISYTPETALDSWQYNIISSTDENVIGHSNAYNTWAANGFGDATVRIGNNTTNDVTYTLDVTVTKNAVETRSAYWNSVWGETSKYNVVDNDATSVVIYDRIVSYIGLYTSPDGSDNSSLTFTLSRTDLFTIDYNPSNYLFTIDATGDHTPVTEDTRVTLTVDWGYGSTTLYIWVVANEEVTQDMVTGTWKFEDATLPAYTLEMTTEDYVFGTNKYYKGILTGNTYTVTFGYEIANGGEIKAYGVTVASTDSTYETMLDSFHLWYFTDTNTLGVQFAVGTWGGLDDVSITELLGSATSDDEGFTDYSYAEFVKQ